ncbi:unnamed protein product [Vitrella brassicaformis CCMP3155]|uniref:CTP synthase n=1 Tax=Vitrella brassicaformis (strain CCMP3155) TaxID=1169540 RepID=A0A0G4H034_VITBC|nr:unnamed protein product [Vitrella brassicaformis CCMP3155]|eukprot:CEM36859.1 unnamed protein product [Vitrella brassicaformis CCMP3155]
MRLTGIFCWFARALCLLCRAAGVAVHHVRHRKYAAITGGTMSGLGKGTVISSLGWLLKALGLRVTVIKIDPYLNIDAGTMAPREHGEVYVLKDGAEVDLDFGNYERALNVTLTGDHSITAGKIYRQVIEKERKGEYLGRTVQLVPHVTDAVQDWIERIAEVPVDGKEGPPDICLIELGGTAGELESLVHLEALRCFSRRVGPENFALVHLGFVACTGDGEQKTKPTQQSIQVFVLAVKDICGLRVQVIQELRKSGLKADWVFRRSKQALGDAAREKIAHFGELPKEHVVSVHDVPNLYRVPLMLEEQNVGAFVCEVKIGIVGKYTRSSDAYLSVVKALQHAAIEAALEVDIRWIAAENLETQMQQKHPAEYEEARTEMQNVDGVVCPGGFGDRGVEGKILSSRFCRRNSKPFLGICLGLQTAVIGFARDELQMEHANSEEFDSNSNNPKVVVSMPEVSTEELGGTMRLGSRPTVITDRASLASKLYDHRQTIYERHRHRYEVKPAIVPELEAKGLMFTGRGDGGQRMEIAEIPSHPYFVCCQFHPEYESRPMAPAPLFLGLVLAAKGRLENRLKQNGGQLGLLSTDAN